MWQLYKSDKGLSMAELTPKDFDEHEQVAVADSDWEKRNTFGAYMRFIEKGCPEDELKGEKEMAQNEDDEPEMQQIFSTRVVKVCIDSEQDRKNMLMALAGAGHKVWVEYDSLHCKYWVCFENEAENG
jgi:hypothetical protein